MTERRYLYRRDCGSSSLRSLPAMTDGGAHSRVSCCANTSVDGIAGRARNDSDSKKDCGSCEAKPSLILCARSLRSLPAMTNAFRTTVAARNDKRGRTVAARRYKKTHDRPLLLGRFYLLCKGFNTSRSLPRGSLFYVFLRHFSAVRPVKILAVLCRENLLPVFAGLFYKRIGKFSTNSIIIGKCPFCRVT
jgi:hypothetical protein